LPEADATLRSNLEQRAEQEGLNALHQELLRIDPVAASRIHPNDPQRLLRALEVYYITGTPLSMRQQHRKTEHQHRYFNVGIWPSDRAVLHRRIELRFDQMLEQGFVDEVTGIINLDEMHGELPSMRCVGYRQVCDMLAGECSQKEMRERGVAATRQLAKRQLTWMRRMEDLVSVNLSPSIDDVMRLDGFRDWMQANGIDL